MNKSDTIIELAKALVEAQKVMTGAKMDGANPFFHSTYSTLSSVWEACRKPLTDNGLSVAQICDTVEGQSCIETTLLHSSGEWISGRYLLTPVKPDPQSVGSAITYARRYALAAMVGICPEDDDAESTMGRDNPKVASKPKTESKVVEAAKEAGAVEKTKPDDPATEPQLKAIFAIQRDMGITDEKDRYEYVSRILELEETLTSFKSLSKAQASKVIKQLDEDKRA